MVISKEEIIFLRKLEEGNQGFYLTSRGLEKLREFSYAGVLKNIIPVPFLPKFLGGDWQIGCAVGRIPLGETKVENPAWRKEIINAVPYIYELVYNWTLPSSVGHNTAFFFYTRDIKEIKERLSKVNHFECFNLYPLSSHSFPLKLSLSTEEKDLLVGLLTSPSLLSHLGDLLVDEKKQTKLKGILLDEHNPYGFLSILPEIDWSNIENFIHGHFLSSQKEGLKQIEVDLWSFSELAKSYEALLERGEIKGLIVYKRNEPLNYWWPECL